MPAAIDDDQEFEKKETVSINKEVLNRRFIEFFMQCIRKESMTSTSFTKLVLVKCLNTYLIIKNNIVFTVFQATPVLYKISDAQGGKIKSEKVDQKPLTQSYLKTDVSLSIGTVA